MKAGGLVLVFLLTGAVTVDQPTTLIGEGRGVTIIRGGMTFTGTERPSYLEVDHGPVIENVTFEGPKCLRLEGLGYISIEHVEFRNCDIAIELAGSLQARISDVLFVSNRVGISAHPAPVAYYDSLPELPPNRILVEFCTFYYSWRAIDWRGGEQLTVRDSEFGMNGVQGDDTSGALWLDGKDIILDRLWLESNAGHAVITTTQPAILRDSFFAYSTAPETSGPVTRPR